MGCLPHGNSPLRRNPSAGTRPCNTDKRQQEEKAAALLPHRCHCSVRAQTSPAHAHSLLSANVGHKSPWTLFPELGWDEEEDTDFLCWSAAHPEPHQLVPTIPVTSSHSPEHLLLLSAIHFFSTRTGVICVMSHSSPASNNTGFFCPLLFLPVLSHAPVPLRLQPCVSPCVPRTAVGICKPASVDLVKKCCRSDGFHFASQETQPYNIIDTNNLRENYGPHLEEKTITVK